MRSLTDLDPAWNANAHSDGARTFSDNFKLELGVQESAFGQRKVELLDAAKAVGRTKLEEVSISSFPQAFRHPDAAYAKYVMVLQRCSSLLPQHFQAAY